MRYTLFFFSLRAIQSPKYLEVNQPFLYFSIKIKIKLIVFLKKLLLKSNIYNQKLNKYHLINI